MSVSQGATQPTGATTLGDANGVQATIGQADSLVEAGEVREAVTLLTKANRSEREARLELALARIRHAGYDAAGRMPRQERSPAKEVTFDFIDGLPAIEPDQLTSTVLTTAIERHGCLLVPGLFDAQQVEQAVEGIERAFEAEDRHAANPSAPRSDEDRAWFEPFAPVGRYADMAIGGRSFTRSTGGVWTIESPRNLFNLIDDLERTPVIDAIAGHLGEWPALSAAKCNIRRTPVDIPGGWHQDGSFIGLDVTSVDVWIALSDCGRDAPGLDVIPHRFEHLLPTSILDVVIDHQTVLDEIAPLGVEIIGREFAAGDAMLFDHMFLHRTATEPHMTRDRYALETWFFGPSCYPKKQIPLLC